MSSFLFFPPASIVKSIDRAGAVPLHEVLRIAGVRCRASGAWIERPIILVRGREGLLEREPGEWGAVRIGFAERLSERQAARYAVEILAYGLMDLVARESIRGAPWAKLEPPRGRPRTGAALSGAERQRRHRTKRAALGG